MTLNDLMDGARKEIWEKTSEQIERQVFAALGTGMDLAVWERMDAVGVEGVTVTLAFRLVEPGVPARAPAGYGNGRLYHTSRQPLGRA